MTLVFAHRGASRVEPENTVAAFERARALGADGVEFDVRRTADDRLVVHHDALVADGRVIRETVAAELPADLPSFSQAIEACEGMIVNVEIKNHPAEPDFDESDWVASRVAAELARRGPSGRWLISSFRLETVDRCRRLLPQVRTAWLTEDLTDDMIATAVAHRHVAVHPWVERLDRDAIGRAHAAGLAVNTWTCDEPERLRELIAWGVDGICTNVPDVAVAIRSA